MSIPENKPTSLCMGMQGIVTNNTHFVENKTGDRYEIESVIGYDKAGGEQTYYAWLFPEAHPARAVLIPQTGKVQID